MIMISDGVKAFIRQCLSQSTTRKMVLSRAYHLEAALAIVDKNAVGDSSYPLI